MNNWLDDVHIGKKEIRLYSHYIRAIANDLDNVGLTSIAEDLIIAVERIENANDLIYAAIGDMLNQEIAKGQNQLHGVFLSALESLNKSK